MVIEHSSRIIYALIPVLALIIMIPYGLQPAHASCSDLPGPGVDYSGCDLTSMSINFNNLDLSGANLAGADLSNLELRNVKLIGANLDGANLQGVFVENADLTNAIATNVVGTSANLQNAVLTNADFSGASLDYADFTNSNITHLKLSGADISYSDFTDAYIHDNTFDSGTQFAGASFIRSDLSLSDVSGLDLSGVNFNGANFTGSNLSGSILADSTFICSSTPSGPVCTNFTNADLSNADLTGALVVNANFSGANLSGATLDCHGNSICASSDHIPPVVTPPANQEIGRASSLGSIVFYPTATATDNVGIVGQVTCTPASGTLFPVGTTTVDCSASDAAGNVGHASFVVTVQDTTAPTITVPSTVTQEASSSGGATVTYAVSATDNVGIVGQVTCTPASGTLFARGTTTVDCSASDAAGNVGHASFVVTVQDTTAPTITVPSTITKEATGPLGATVTYAVSASDLVDGTVPVACTPTSGSQFGLTTTNVSCNAHDTAGNTATASFSVIVKDTTAPLLIPPIAISLPAIGPLTTVSLGTPTVTDIVDPHPTVTNNAPSGGFPVGTATVTWTPNNEAHNTQSATLSVTVPDTTAPAITAPPVTAQATGPSGATVTYSVSATDLVDGTVPVTCDHLSGSSFPIGSTTVSCNATDHASNVSHASFTITVSDTAQPTITAPPVTAEATSANGASVTYTVSATDPVDGTVPVTCTPASGTLFGFGITNVDCSASDAAGNVGHASFVVTVQDTTAPTITAPPAISMHATGPLTTVSLGTPTVTDIVDPHPTVTNNAPSGGFPVGTTTVTWTAKDGSGNTATALQTVTIIPNNTPGKITGGGQIAKDTNFGFDVKSYDGIHFTGHLEFNVKSPKIDLDSKSITGLFVDTSGKQGTFDGTATVNDKSGYTFHVYVEDNGEPGTHDVFKIQIFDSTGTQIYSGGGTIISGNIQIHKSGQASDGGHNTGHGDDNHGNSGHGDDNHGNSG